MKSGSSNAPGCDEIRHVLLSGGREVGGLQSFASNVGSGFDALGISSEIVGTPRAMLRRWKAMRDPTVLKIFSTWAIFLCPFARNAIAVAHGFPRVDAQGVVKFLAILASFKLAQRTARLVAVSGYVQRHLSALFDIRCVAAIHNPLPACWSGARPAKGTRNLITYIGRLHPVKRTDEFLPAVIDMLDANPQVEALIVGSGECKAELLRIANGHARVHFVESMSSQEVMNALARTKVFFSGCDTEAFGISLLEAAVSGCNIVTTGSGGFVEVLVPDINTTAFLLPPNFSREQCLAALEAALSAPEHRLSDEAFLPAAIARLYMVVAEPVSGRAS
ncbi:GDP-mannose-dependent alpha-(1-6)-phosphatidylinositol monomannoside mannosyltransferase [Caballeronia hypogeia]|uniref:GDP-mannose-dependent alpha-(1-6)-phosphatidylinositol monomannoside mannosyltransferase n=1 Tax=Caballeronia hypogeia TaxID=1777140 RepID=A0A158DEF4_9BURK|nr:glycosyltransferase family 4 protein [Caballeronia hypogeia]SAK92931.1 GDP-mannose-dependent alpha-(1-6)-phosphatidylinositol monomannoside mannosyltransferase [Caballeronia hypogeia]